MYIRPLGFFQEGARFRKILEHRRGEKGCSPLQWRKPAYGESSWRGGDICVGVLAQDESGPKFSQVMRANSVEAGSSWLTQTLFFQVHENEQFSCS